MKRTKLIMILSFITLYSCTTFAQDNCVKEGNFIIDVYYGYPYLVGSVLKAASTGTDVTVNNTNHIGARFEYMVSDKIGLGIDYTYAKVTMHETNPVSANNGVTYYGKYSASFTKQRALIRMNLHFATGPKIDPYAAFGIGYKQTLYQDNYPSTYDDSFKINFLPIAFRLGIGMHYFFTENVGINVEAGIGGPAVQGGITFKI